MSARGTIQRSPTSREYASEIEKLYGDADKMSAYSADRTSSARSRRQEKYKNNNESTDFSTSKVTYLKIDLSKSGLEVDNETCKRIQSSAADIIHSAWPVNFNLSLETHKPQLDGIINLLSFVSTIPHHVSLLFLSSISSILGLESTSIPEMIIDDTSAPLPMGYAKSKFISECILDHAARELSIDIKVARSWLRKLKDTTRKIVSGTTQLEEILEKYLAIKLLEFSETLPETKWSDKDVEKAIE
ncbi:uncharacterized protein EAF01_001551 [Botrytis porri]|uniref:uncharacterized protein n=1 Tax=Botrytis porri TaxID=87229 RepID=UPI0018FF8944|nr:uncharacterized protein EAF01_001551 [Botrytis porri]KAF7912530.1 hypothetical protein EAF01_001551 [Botrytis porri]